MEIKSIEQYNLHTESIGYLVGPPQGVKNIFFAGVGYILNLSFYSRFYCVKVVVKEISFFVYFLIVEPAVKMQPKIKIHWSLEREPNITSYFSTSTHTSF